MYKSYKGKNKEYKKGKRKKGKERDFTINENNAKYEHWQLKTKCASLLPLNQEVKSQLINLNIRVNPEATWIKNENQSTSCLALNEIEIQSGNQY